ncbi:lysozyme inhibitor LprI family protein [Massilia sp. TS11]|uniref:lysozyme inhibitor LprI family protein n=1 Tax=Massilia sp. TS11 TaxID=2908003 RepID=UPI001EDAD0B3|nr:lysozyme inhibitor LprI family protein [Massilia sp. TS11]MCG2583166.1 lysozyme inhibitor LprI family protein [Massilia sp. TS11]
MAKRIALAFTLLAGATCVAYAAPQSDLVSTEKSLRIISEFANSMCANPSYQGSQSSLNANASAKADLNRLLRNLVDAKVELGAETKSEQFQGLLQKDLLDATKLASECRLKIFSDLKDRLLPRQGANDPLPSTRPKVRPSFDCDRSGKGAERLVCSSQDISILDLSMANAFRDVLAEQKSNEARTRWKNAQNAWLKQVRNQCGDILCLTDVYTKRIDYLRQARGKG